MSKEAMKLALEGAANYIDALGGDSRKYRQTLANIALDKMAENARELGLDYEPKQEPIIKSYLKKDNSQPVKWSDYEPDGMHHNKRPQNCGTGYCSCIECVMEPPQRTWVGLSDEAIWLEYQKFWPFHPAEEPTLAKDIAKFANAIEAKLKEKNT